LAVGYWRLAISFSETNLLFVKRPPTSSQLAPRGQTKQTLNAPKSMATIFLMRNVMPKEGVVCQKKNVCYGSIPPQDDKTSSTTVALASPSRAIF
jgi:hypothetical protein